MLDCGSYCNFISNKLVDKLNLKIQTTKTQIKIKGISGITTTLNQYVKLNFILKLLINNKFYFIKFSEKFLVTNAIPTDLLLGNLFMTKYKIHYSYEKNYLYTSFNNKNLKSKFSLDKINHYNNNNNNNNNFRLLDNYNNNDNNNINNFENRDNSFSKNKNFKFSINNTNNYFRNSNSYLSTFYNKIKENINNKTDGYSKIYNKNNKIKNKCKRKNKFNRKKFIYSFLTNKSLDLEDIDEDDDNEEPKLEDIPTFAEIYVRCLVRKKQILYLLTDSLIVKLYYKKMLHSIMDQFIPLVKQNHKF